MPMISFNTTPNTKQLIDTVVVPLGMALDAVYLTPEGNPTPEGKPDVQSIVSHLTSIGPALGLLLRGEFIKKLSGAWHTQLADAVGTAVTGLVPVFVSGAKLVVHFAQQKP